MVTCRPRLPFFLALRFCLTVALIGLLPTGSGQGAEEFRLSKRLVKIPERGEVVGYTLLAESNKLSFLPPPGWQIRGNPSERQVIFLPRELTASISVKILPAHNETNTILSSSLVRQLARERYPEARVREQFTCYVNGSEGEAIDLERTGGNNVIVLTRLAYVLVPGGLVEFNLTAPGKSFSEYQFAFANLLAGFRCESCAATESIPAKSDS